MEAEQRATLLEELAGLERLAGVQDKYLEEQKATRERMAAILVDLGLTQKRQRKGKVEKPEIITGTIVSERTRPPLVISSGQGTEKKLGRPKGRRGKKGGILGETPTEWDDGSRFVSVDTTTEWGNKPTTCQVCHTDPCLCEQIPDASVERYCNKKGE